MPNLSYISEITVDPNQVNHKENWFVLTPMGYARVMDNGRGVIRMIQYLDDQGLFDDIGSIYVDEWQYAVRAPEDVTAMELAAGFCLRKKGVVTESTTFVWQHIRLSEAQAKKMAKIRKLQW